MSLYKVLIYKRNQPSTLQNYNYGLSYGYVSTIEEVFVEADGYEFSDNGILEFYASRPSMNMLGYETAYVRMFHWNQWLEVERVEDVS